MSEKIVSNMLGRKVRLDLGQPGKTDEQLAEHKDPNSPHPLWQEFGAHGEVTSVFLKDGLPCYVIELESGRCVEIHATNVSTVKE